MTRTTASKVLGSGVVIRDFAWLGDRVIVLPGIRIGKGAVVASGPIVTKDVPPFAVMAGMPARKVSERSQDPDYSIDTHLPFIRSRWIVALWAAVRERGG